MILDRPGARQGRLAGVDDPARPCFNCGYDVRAVPSGGVCPECGNLARDAREVIDYQAVGWRRTRWKAGAAVVGLGAFFVLFFAFMTWLAP